MARPAMYVLCTYVYVCIPRMYVGMYVDGYMLENETVYKRSRRGEWEKAADKTQIEQDRIGGCGVGTAWKTDARAHKWFPFGRCGGCVGA